MEQGLLKSKYVDWLTLRCSLSDAGGPNTHGLKNMFKGMCPSIISLLGSQDDHNFDCRYSSSEIAQHHQNGIDIGLVSCWTLDWSYRLVRNKLWVVLESYACPKFLEKVISDGFICELNGYLDKSKGNSESNLDSENDVSNFIALKLDYCFVNKILHNLHTVNGDGD